MELMVSDVSAKSQNPSRKAQKVGSKDAPPGLPVPNSLTMAIRSLESDCPLVHLHYALQKGAVFLNLICSSLLQKNQ